MRSLVVVFVLVALALLGCGEASDESTGSPNASRELEAIIERQLPKQARRFTRPGGEVFVRRVGCVRRSGTDYECIAALQIIEGFRVYTERLPISGTCGGAECIWRVDL